MEKRLGCTIVINNVTGGGGSIGLATADQKQTRMVFPMHILQIQTPTVTSCWKVFHIRQKILRRYVNLQLTRTSFVTSNASGITDMDGLIAAGQDGTTLWGIGGAWTHWDFVKLEFEEATGTNYKRLVYDGGASVMY